MARVLLLGLLIWTAATIGIRLEGHRLLRPGQPTPTALLYLASFALMALLVRQICRRLGLEREAWFKAATLFILPTLVLDPFSCLFFDRVFPHIDPGAAGVFGGWMLTAAPAPSPACGSGDETTPADPGASNG